MAAGAAHALAHFFAAMGLSAVAVAVLARLAEPLGLVDIPGGRKEHAHAVPLVGGLAIFIVLLAAAALLGIAPRASHFLLALATVIAVGLWDDVAELTPRLKFGIQMLACAIMIWGAGVELRSVGDLLGWRPIGLWIFAVPLTVFAVVGVVNAVNMMDGLDGLAGSIALVSFAWYALAAAYSGLDIQFEVAVLLCGAIAGFLAFNLRLPWQRHARVFLGDAGSLMIGFALGWYAIDLTQGQGRTMPPIAALWVLLLPLADCVSLMARRLAARRSPFAADRHHIHHYLLARGVSPGRTVSILVAASTAFGAVGFAGWRLGVPEAALFWPFFFGFFAYHAWIQRAWRRLDARVATSPAVFARADDEVRALG